MIRRSTRVLLFLTVLFAGVAGVSSSVTPAAAATVTVSTCNAPSLASAIDSAASGDTITFACSGTINSIAFAPYRYSITKDLTIDGTGQNVTLDGGGQTSLFLLGNSITFTVKGLTIANGFGASYSSCTGCDSADYAGAITQQGGTLNIIDSTFTNNQNQGSTGGGAIVSRIGTLNIDNSTFNNNSSYHQGGAVLSLIGTLNIRNSTFNNNVSQYYGGAVHVAGGEATISGSTFNGNIADAGAGRGGGGAISNTGDITIINSTFIGNQAIYGGAITNTGTIDLFHSTLRDNEAFYWGNGIYTGGVSEIFPCCGGTTNITNSILANADASPRGVASDLPLGSNCSGVNPVGNGGGNLADDDRCGVTQVATADLKLGSLANNGGPTQTTALQSGSVAINKVTCLASVRTDQRGFTRPATGLETCDIGAYEAGAVNPIQTTTMSGVSGAGTYQGAATLTARLAVGGTGVSGKSIAFSLNGTGVGVATTGSDGVATLSGVSLTGIASGSYPGAIGASFAGDASYTASSSSGALTVSQVSATVSLDSAKLSQTYTGNPNIVTATTTPPGLSYSVTYSGSSTPPINAGSYAIVATITDPNYSGNISGTLTVSPANQSIQIETPPPASATYGTSFTVVATASSGLPVSYSGSGACSNVDATFTMVSGSGECVVTIAQAGNGNFNAATPIVIIVTADKATQTIQFTSPAPEGAVYGNTYTPAATGGASGNPVTLDASGACTIDSSAGIVTMTAVGNCTVTANQAGDANHDAAVQVTQTFSVARAGLSVVANDVMMLYGSTVPTFDATVTGLANGDGFAALGGTCRAEVAGSPVSSSTSPGVYPAAITCSGVNTTNYDVTYTPGKLTVAIAPQMTSADAAEFTVGVEWSFAVTASGVPAVTFSTVDQLPDGLSLGSDGTLFGTASTGTAGIYTIEIVASNGIDPDARQIFTLTVVVPEIIAPADMTVPNDTGFGGAIVTYPAPGTIGQVGEVTCTPASGSFFELGTTTVTCVSSQTPATDSFTITVEDAVPPTIVAPVDIELPPTSPSGVVVTYPAPVVTDNAPGVTFVCDPSSGTLFQIGETTVTCTATDTSGNTASATFIVNVLSGAELLDQMQTMVSDLSIVGTSSTAANIRRTLLTMVAAAQMSEAAGLDGMTCLMLNQIDLEIRTQVSKRRITSANAAEIYAQTNTTRIAIGCGTR